MTHSFNSYEQLLAQFLSMPRKRSTLLVGIDGCGASGKTSFAQKIAALAIQQVTTVQMDDFLLSSRFRLARNIAAERIGADIDWQRLHSQVFQRLLHDASARYQVYDWNTDSLQEWYRVPVGGIVIIEGVYSTCKEIADIYDFKIWIDCPREKRLARGLARDGEKSRHFWEVEWMPMEDYYVESEKPQTRADLIVDGTELFQFQTAGQDN